MDVQKTICQNPWCKATFEFTGEIKPTVCPKCQSFDKELSGGITWIDKKYDSKKEK